MIPARTFSFVLLVAALALMDCSGAGGSVPAMQARPATSSVHSSHRRAPTGPIAHIVLLIQENRSFDNLFATFPGADGTTTGTLHTGKVIPLKAHSLKSLDVSHTYATYLTDYDGGKMDGFDRSTFLHESTIVHRYPYQYVKPKQIQAYWTLAEQYALADQMFQTQGSGSFTAHQDLIAGGTVINSKQSLVDTPSGSPWGCDAPPSTLTTVLTTSGRYLRNKGPFPCLTYPTGTMRDLLDAKAVSWKYYSPVYKVGAVGALWNAFAAIQAVREGPEWTTNVSIPQTNIFNDITNNQLPAVSWVIPDNADSDHPQDNLGADDGPSWIAQVVNAIGTSSYWDSTAIVIVWDDWGGFYDHVPPPFLDDAGGLGFRVPMIVVSPYVPAGTISHTQYEYGSILKFIEERFELGSLGTTDVRATSIGNIFDFDQSPRTFVPIPAQRPRAYFLHERPSLQPVDTE
ncbi:MAG: alkaline phosphatase family protein [Candidatus Tumulicola sp.]